VICEIESWNLNTALNSKSLTTKMIILGSAYFSQLPKMLNQKLGE
jgi:hypothetical protein